MIKFSSEQIRNTLRGIGVRQIRLASGLVMFAYVTSHFLNHSLGNISVDAMTSGVYYHTLFWQFPPVAFVLYTAVLVHLGLGVWALYQRRQFLWRTTELLQLLLGLSIPVLIASHVIGVRVGGVLFGHEKLYPQVLYAFWVAQPDRGLIIATVLIIAWTHGCIGLNFWLRMKAFYARLAPFLLAAAVLVPTLALLGFYQGGQSVIADSSEAEWRTQNLSPRQVGTAAEARTLEAIVDGFLIGYLSLLGIVMLARGARVLLERRGGMITLSYGNGRVIRVPKGLSVLEASLRYSVPHASVCGGRARCSTCRIRVIGDHTCLQPGADRSGALSRQPVRGYARFDPACRKDAAVRHRVRRQPLPRGSGAGGHRDWRQAKPVRRRRHAGAVRAWRERKNRLPPGAQGGRPDRQKYRRAEPVFKPRSARADPFRHRNSRRRGDRRRHRLPRPHGVYRARRPGQCRRPAAGHDQVSCLRGDPVRRGARHGGPCRRRSAVPGGDHPRPRRADDRPRSRRCQGHIGAHRRSRNCRLNGVGI